MCSINFGFAALESLIDYRTNNRGCNADRVQTCRWCSVGPRQRCMLSLLNFLLLNIGRRCCKSVSPTNYIGAVRVGGSANTHLQAHKGLHTFLSRFFSLFLSFFSSFRACSAWSLATKLMPLSIDNAVPCQTALSLQSSARTPCSLGSHSTRSSSGRHTWLMTSKSSVFSIGPARGQILQNTQQKKHISDTLALGSLKHMCSF